MNDVWTSLRQLGMLTVLTALGAFSAIGLGMPVPLLTGPAIVLTTASLTGLRLTFPSSLRSAVFLLAGIAIGATVSSDSMAALARWPLAFAILGIAIALMVRLGQVLMQRMLRTDRSSALLAAAPGHLSFVIAIGEDMGLATDRIAVVQSIRLLALTILVPFLIRFAGFETGIGLAPDGGTVAEMSILQTVLAIGAAIALAPIVKWTGAPAPMLLAGMAVGAAARLSEMVPGGLSHYVALPVLAAIGALIGTRFAGTSLAQLRLSIWAGVAGTTLAAVLTLGAAWATMGIVDMPLAHVLVAFAPGGLETMAVIGAAIGANPGFVAAAHVARLLLLSVLIPVMLARAQQPLPRRE